MLAPETRTRTTEPYSAHHFRLDEALDLTPHPPRRHYPWAIRKGDGSAVQRDHRASDAERQAVVRRLERALRAGRLTVVEFDERARATYAATMCDELDALTEDLPPDLW
jgi:hypothetical protein